MNLKDPTYKEQLQNSYKRLFNKFDRLMTTLMNTPTSYKRAALLFYWLNQYYGYIKGEPTFKPQFCPALVKGNIVKVNFGFNLGNEFGGLHYAIVMNDSSVNNGVVTVIPLRSLKPTECPDTLRGNDIYLGDELYSLLTGKIQGLHQSSMNQMDDITKMLTDIAELSDQEIRHCQTKLSDLENKLSQLDTLQKEFFHLKTGSVAIVNQIRTISKMRIEDPKNKCGILYGIRLSRVKMQLIKDELMCLYDM